MPRARRARRRGSGAHRISATGGGRRRDDVRSVAHDVASRTTASSVVGEVGSDHGEEEQRRPGQDTHGLKSRSSPATNWCMHAPPWYSRSTMASRGGVRERGYMASFGHAGGPDAAMARRQAS